MQSLQFSNREFERRHAAVRAEMAKAEVKALVVAGNVASHSEIIYLTNFPVTHLAWLLFPIDGPMVLFVQYVNHQANARRFGIVEDVRWAGDDAGATLAAEIARRGLETSRIGLLGSVSFREYSALAAQFPAVELIDFASRFHELRLVKSQEEIAFARRGAELSDLAIDALIADARVGSSEYDLAAMIECSYLPLSGKNHIHFIGATPMRSPSLCAPAQTHSERRLEKGDVVLTEISASYHGYWGQILRTFSVGERPTLLYERLHDVALETYRRVCAVIRDGASSDAVLDAAQYVHAEGFTIYDDLVHCAPGNYAPYLRTRKTTVGKAAQFTFRTDMLIVVQPNVITEDERMGVQVGDMLRVTPDGVESLHRHPLRFLQLAG
jgi:Xaa-Pro dipeptidase